MTSVSSVQSGNTSPHTLAGSERLQNDLRSAGRILGSLLLPQEAPNVEGYDFEWWYETAYEIGGDFYGWSRLSDRKTLIVTGDACGKGISAAIMMTLAVGAIRHVGPDSHSPAWLLSALNQDLFPEDPSVFATAVAAVVDHTEGSVTLVNAGHPRPLIKKADGKVTPVKEGQGFPLGMMGDIRVRRGNVTLEPGDRMCFFTDGVTECMDERDECLGPAKLQEALQMAPSNGEGIVQRVRAVVNRHTRGRPQRDDITFLCFGPRRRDDT